MAENLTTIISSPSQSVTIHRDAPTVIIGERINPTGRKSLQKAMEAGDWDIVRQDALEQLAAGALVLDVNAGVPDGDEPALLEAALRAVMTVADAPICIDTANPEALKAALTIYPGKALVNSVNGEMRTLEAILPLVKAHEAAVIGLCLDDNGIPPTAEQRLAVAARIIQEATRRGIAPADVVIDPLVLTLGADTGAGKVALETIALVVKEFGVNITMGASNVSFGLPDRPSINAAFIAMAIHAGLTCPITNPLEPALTRAVLAADLAMGKDEWGMRWIEAFRARASPEAPPAG